jgi:hypothetical protein
MKHNPTLEEITLRELAKQMNILNDKIQDVIQHLDANASN